MKYGNLREEYKHATLLETDLLQNPFEMFEKWFEEAKSVDPKDANAMVLSSTSVDGWPNGRVVLLKGFDTGFVWFTNYLSQKAQDLDANPKASLTFWWPKLERQVRITGSVSKTSESESDQYFLSRPIGSQAGAIASLQSSVIKGRSDLEARYAEIFAHASEEPLKRPEHWGGYRLLPHYFEFWQGRESRLHDRLCYWLKDGKEWETGRLSP